MCCAKFFQVTAVVMHLGEMKFKKKSGKDDQAQPDGTETGGNVAKLLGNRNISYFFTSFKQLIVILTLVNRCLLV